ncbi:hypothetical protein PPTG_11775 [Phytophthora nicotianae INRA-310]|uniref:BED-type domain-containing protein n=3 Tax=Phytophthora nicotianae TaxID=4792 RepID=W2Q9Z6_PHYN3|nr:hypothetical protein PPTG_11775 [Phytophthora nicotianae INRA-310]ETL40706.1 hypothetical protein L916_08168 [Phytophthora nicotianae]ETO76075.1 hypothetical protein F444_08467 [Phytophthora nicotianae P1976]KUF93975.1 hypothetical protein AM587_10013964 [Phytophthora nicotianae]ETN09354.1 hypothetical protein PPTG_11775 [Phytophthora nicotianae INRA-310]KUF98165.1 Nucleolar protein 12 [Phytophthora nicotianae]
MVKPLNKEWQLFGHKYRVAGAKGAKVDCKACHKQVSAAVNRLQSHMRICPARSSLATTLLNSTSNNKGGSSSTGIPEAIPTTSELIEQALEVSSLAAEQAAESNANAAESNGPPAKKHRLTTAKTRDHPRWNDPASSSMNADDVWLNSVATGPTTAITPASEASLNKKRLEIEEKRLQLEITRDQREERRERLNLEILETQVKREKLLAEKEEYEAKVLLALSRKQLRDQGVSEEEIDRILPVSSPQANNSNTTEATCENDATADQAE